MENFDWTTFTLKTAIKAELADIYQAWTKPSEITKWFLSKTTYHRNGNLISETDSILSGDTYAWSWFLYDVVEDGKITETNGKDFLQFTFAETCLVDINLEEKEGFTLISLTQKNIPTDDTSKYRIRLGCESGWAFFLTNLKSVYEGGLDLRNKHEVFKGLLNN